MGRMLLLDKVTSSGQVEGFCIVKSASEKVDKNGRTYLDLILSDVGGEINAKLWDYDKTLHSYIKAECIVKIRAAINKWRDTEQLKIDRIRQYNPDADELDLSTIVPASPLDTESMYEEILDIVRGFSDDDLKRLVEYMLTERKENFINWPAALKLHHAHKGGLAYHTHTMLKLARGICDIYTALNPELVYAGIILHDLAKIDELTVGTLGLVTGYSVRGQLIGHIAMGVANIETAAQKLGIREGIKTLMQHIILAHHSNPDFGSPKPPMFPEAEVVATVDMLDARMYEMYDALESVETGGFTERIWSMDNRMLYKHEENA